MAGLAVFVVLAIVGTKAYHGVVANQKEANQVKALTDAVSVVAEQLSALTVATLTEPGSKYLSWSEPAPIGSGEYLFRYHTVPKPKVNGAQDTSTVGLEVEIGPASTQGGFTAARLFATLIAPHISSKDKLGQVSTQKERDAEAAFYASHQAQIASVTKQEVGDNQLRLNSYSCYNEGQCCGFMKHYFSNPSIQPQDGLDEKCYYRCAMAGNVSVQTWNGACGENFCALAPWKTKEQCCAAIQADECKPGSVCANVCIGCLGEDGSTCGPPICDGGWWNDFFDCANGTFCNGQPLTSNVEGWGDVATLCKTTECSAVKSECQARIPTCCRDYWGVLNMGGDVDPKALICKSITPQSDCCMMPLEVWDWDQIQCGTDGHVVTAHNKIDGKWYCGLSGSGWDKECAYAKGCSATYTPQGAGQGCANWTGVAISGPWQATYPKPDPVVVQTTTGGGTPTPTTTKQTTTSDVSATRAPSNRKGSVFGSWGGRE
jgi:hypothetical protein